jgi:hypothetical protein
MIPLSEPPASLKKVLRIATDEDLQVRMDLQRFEQDATGSARSGSPSGVCP